MAFPSNAKANSNGVKKVYESAIFVPWQFLSDSVTQAELQNGRSQLAFDLGPVTIEAEDIPINLSNIHVSVDTILKNTGSQNGETLWLAEQMNTQIQVSGFTIEKYMEQWVGGVKARIHLKATCSPFDMQQSGAQMQMSWGWTSQATRLQAALSSLDLFWPPGSWQIGEIHCEGPKGFADVIQAEIKKQLSNPDMILPTLKRHMEEHFNSKIASALEQYRKPQWLFNDLQTALVMEMTGIESVVEKGLVFKGKVEVQRLQSSTTQAPREDLVPLDVERTIKGINASFPALMLPGVALESLIADMAENRVAVYDLNRFSGFNGLMQSRFKQWFVWPDLMKYPKNAFFSVTSRVDGRPEIRYTQDHRMYVQGYVDSWIYSQREGKNWRYVDMRSGFAAWVYPDVSKGFLRLSFAGQNLNSAARMSPDYVSRFRPSTRIDVRTIEKSIKKADFFQGVTMELPSLEMESGKRYKASKIIRSNKDVFIVELLPENLKGIAGL